MRLAIAYVLVAACVVAAFVARWREMGEDERERAKFARRAKRKTMDGV